MAADKHLSECSTSLVTVGLAKRSELGYKGWATLQSSGGQKLSKKLLTISLTNFS